MMLWLCVTLAQTVGQQAPVAPASGTNSDMLVWAAVALLAALVLFILELLVPSGGILSVAAVIAMAVGNVLLYLVDITLGLAGTALCLIAIPVAVIIAIRIFPHTWVGSRMILSSPKVDPAKSAFSDTPRIGAVGQSVTRLHPVGTCVIDGKRVECIASGGMIDPDTQVEVIASGGMEVKVRAKAD